MIFFISLSFPNVKTNISSTFSVTAVFWGFFAVQASISRSNVHRPTSMLVTINFNVDLELSRKKCVSQRVQNHFPIFLECTVGDNNKACHPKAPLILPQPYPTITQFIYENDSWQYITMLIFQLKKMDLKRFKLLVLYVFGQF